MKDQTKSPTCKVEIFDQAKIDKVKKELPSSEEIIKVADTYKVLSDPTRLKIVLALACSELCVCDLSVLVGISISGISHQLRLLRNNRIVKYRRDGKMAYYSLDDGHISNIIEEVQNHINESSDE